MSEASHDSEVTRMRRAIIQNFVFSENRTSNSSGFCVGFCAGRTESSRGIIPLLDNVSKYNDKVIDPHTCR